MWLLARLFFSPLITMCNTLGCRAAEETMQKNVAPLKCLYLHVSVTRRKLAVISQRISPTAAFLSNSFASSADVAAQEDKQLKAHIMTSVLSLFSQQPQPQSFVCLFMELFFSLTSRPRWSPQVSIPLLSLRLTHATFHWSVFWGKHIRIGL